MSGGGSGGFDKFVTQRIQEMQQPTYVQPKLGSPDTMYALGGGDYNTIKQDPTVLGFDPAETGFQNNPSLMHFLRFGQIPTADELYGPAVSSNQGTQPSGPNTGIVNPNNPDTGIYGTMYSQMYPSTGGALGTGVNPYNALSGLYGGSPYGTVGTASGGNLFNGGINPDSYNSGGYFNVSPGYGKKQADQTMANLARAEYADYLRRFAPVEDALLATIDRTTYNNEVANRDRLRTAYSIGNAFDRSAGMEQRRMGRYGLQYQDDGDMQMREVSSMVGGLNSTTRAATDRRNALIGGGLNQIATESKTGVDFGGSESEDK